MRSHGGESIAAPEQLARLVPRASRGETRGCRPELRTNPSAIVAGSPRLPLALEASMKPITNGSVIRCPGCTAEHEERMPSDACLFFYECPSCHAMLRPKAGDCCVFCSYGTTACPPMQRRDADCDC